MFIYLKKKSRRGDSEECRITFESGVSLASQITNRSSIFIFFFPLNLSLCLISVFEGDYLEINGEYYRIINIIDKNNMNIKQVDGNVIVTGDISGGTLSDSYVINATRVYDLECNDYLILDVPQFHMLDAQAESIDDAFAVIPLSNNEKTIVNRSFTIDEQKKYFNPPLPRLSKINVIFKRYDGSVYDFNGKDHMLGFKITCLNQPGKYNNYND